MKKGLKFIKVEIDADGKMKCYTVSKSGEVSSYVLTRSQRHLFRRYSDSDFVEQVENTFGKNALDETFVITKENEVVYSLDEE